MTVYKRGKTWTANVTYYVDGKRKRKTKSGFDKKKEAEVWERQVNVQKDNNESLSEIEVPSLGDHIREWAKVYKSDVSHQTKVWYKLVAQNADKALGNRPIDKITRTMLQSMINDLSEHYSAASLRKQRFIINQALKVAEYDDIIRKNPMNGITINKTDYNKKDLKFLEQKDLHNLNQFINDIPISQRTSSEMFILLAIHSGARYAELAGLKWSDLYSDRIDINKSWDDMTHEYKTTKTISSNRVVYIEPELVNQFLEWNKSHKNDDPIFIGKTSMPVTNASINKRLKNILKEIGADKIISVHGLRHTHASFLLSQDIDVQYVSERLGHSDVNITLSVYAHLMEKKRVQENGKVMSLFKNL